MSYSCICEKTFPSLGVDLYMHMFECYTKTLSDLKTKSHQERNLIHQEYDREFDQTIDKTRQVHDSIRQTYDDTIALRQKVPELETVLLITENKRLTNLYTIMTSIESDKTQQQYKAKLDNIILEYKTQLHTQQVEFQKREQTHANTIATLTHNIDQLQKQVHPLTTRVATLEHEKEQMTHALQSTCIDRDEKTKLNQAELDKLMSEKAALEHDLQSQKKALQDATRSHRECVDAHTVEKQKLQSHHEHVVTCVKQEYEHDQTSRQKEFTTTIQEKQRLIDEYKQKLFVSECTVRDTNKMLQVANKTIESLREKLKKTQTSRRHK